VDTKIYNPYVAVCKTLARSMFYRNLELPELDKIQTIKELLDLNI